MLPVGVTVRRRSPGVYGVHRKVTSVDELGHVVAALIGVREAHLGDVQRVSPTRWRSRSSRHGADWSGPVYGNRDAAAASLLARPARGPGEAPS